jgi:hypothetical protein
MKLSSNVLGLAGSITMLACVISQYTRTTKWWWTIVFGSIMILLCIAVAERIERMIKREIRAHWFERKQEYYERRLRELNPGG